MLLDTIDISNLYELLKLPEFVEIEQPGVMGK
jgi:hypothetical protein